mmetsp:Transcript_128051/g.362453  ORF Transcript_128051/g.362453 Transcript_128051/m.362453 type:complete len:269 (-) Transcript_128051:395-1201(-)
MQRLLRRERLAHEHGRLPHHPDRLRRLHALLGRRRHGRLQAHAALQGPAPDPHHPPGEAPQGSDVQATRLHDRRLRDRNARAFLGDRAAVDHHLYPGDGGKNLDGPIHGPGSYGAVRKRGHRICQRCGPPVPGPHPVRRGVFQDSVDRDVYCFSHAAGPRRDERRPVARRAHDGRLRHMVHAPVHVPCDDLRIRPLQCHHGDIRGGHPVGPQVQRLPEEVRPDVPEGVRQGEAGSARLEDPGHTRGDGLSALLPGGGAPGQRDDGGGA